ncbi:MAG: alkyl sulfatase BDS1-like metallo-beta-lactamase superfamily hydrolase [Candidatus Aldehydirespiratoraceae bacterium]|jgi:alkyl sulfatase BDS1-like metallo-beta-lactamase superfamily hydrolase
MFENEKTEKKPSSDILVGQLAGTTIGPGLVVLPGQGNSLAIETDAGVVVLDSSAPRHADAMIATLREHTDSPVHAIVYSHGHHGYNAAVDVWQRHNEERGDPAPRLVGHENILKRHARYRETEGLQMRMASVQFPAKRPIPVDVLATGMPLFDPTETFQDTMLLVDGSRRVELIWAPSEVDDALAVWLPDDGLLCGGAATPGFTIPNIGTPLRTQRFTVRWADTLDRFAQLNPTRLLTEFGPLLEGEAMTTMLSATAEALHWVRDEVVLRMNAGMGEHEILADIRFPDELFDRPWMLPLYGAPEYIVRDVYREENGWWDRNPTTLHPAAPADAAAAVLSAVADPQHVLTRARELGDAGDVQLALHVIDLLALDRSDNPAVVEARTLKAELCRTRAKEVKPFVSKSCYRSSAWLLDEGEVSWTALP